MGAIVKSCVQETKSRRNIFILILNLVWFCLISTGANSTQYSYLNGFSVGLGGGFDPSKPHQVFPPCLQLPSGSSDTNLGVASYSFSANLVTDSTSLYKTLGIDVTLDASAEFIGSASSSTTFLQSIAVSSNDVNWVLKIDQTYLPISVSPVGLNAVAQQWASQPKNLYNTINVGMSGSVHRREAFPSSLSFLATIYPHK